jgi:hypothetical protein
MKLRLGRRPGRRRAIGALFAVLALAAAVVVPSSAANAGTLPIGDGTGWSWSYRYTSSDQLYISGTLPGVLVSIGASDVNGDRTLYPLLMDTANDGLCAGLLIATDGNPVMDRIVACDGDYALVTTPTFHGEATIIPFQTVPGSTEIRGAYYVMTIPNFDDDPGLRTEGTGFNWNYTDADNFTFEMVVPGAHVTGNGWKDDAESRGANFTIWWNGAPDCVEGDIQGESDPTIPGSNQAVACPYGSASGSQRYMHNYIELRTFAWPHVLRGKVAVPYRLSH